MIPDLAVVPVVPFALISQKATPFNNTNLSKQHYRFVVRRGQIWSIAKEDPLGIVHLVQPEGSYFLGWDKDVAPYHNKDYLA